MTETSGANEAAPSRVAFLGVMLAVSIALNMIESWIPPFPIPGAKIGLANIVTLSVLLWYGWRDALLLTILRQVAVSVLGGGFLSAGFMLGLSGGITSIVAMQAAVLGSSVFVRPLLSVVGISCIGAVCHNLGQLAAASLILHDATLWRFLPLLIILALPSGLITGLAARELLKVLTKSYVPAGQASKYIVNKIGVGDWSAVVVFVLLSGAVFMGPRFLPPGRGAVALVRIHGKLNETVDLAHDRLVQISVPPGKMIAEVKNHRIRVKESNCLNKICVMSGWINRPGQSLICVPNDVVIQISSSGSSGTAVDAVTY